MMKFRFLLIIIPVTLFLLVLTTAVMAQDVPAPYAGLKNPFSWSDTSTQEAGKGLYRLSCLGCHGDDGGNITGADFSAADYSQGLEERPDFSFWALSEGRPDKGMPPYKSSYSEEQRWQVLTYLWALGKAAVADVPPPPAKPPVVVEKGALQLTMPSQAQSGQPVTISAVLQDEKGKPIVNVPIKLFIQVDFFASGLMEIGETVTDDQGIAVFEHVPQQSGDIQVVARYESVETTMMLTLIEADKPFYQTEAGIRLPAPGKDVFIGPESSKELGRMGEAPASAFRLPGGILSWLLLVVASVMLIWFTYFRAVYQVYRIPIVSEIGDTDTRLVPLAILSVVVALGILLVLMLITSPYSHFHLLR